MLYRIRYENRFVNSPPESKFRAHMSQPIRLHIPGPVEVSPATYAAMAAPMIGHRTKDFVALYDAIQPRL